MTELTLEERREEAHESIDKHIAMLIRDYVAEHPGNELGPRMFDEILRPYAKVVSDAHLEGLDTDDVADMVEATCSYMLTRLIRHTVPADRADMAMEIAGAMLQNVADSVGQTIQGDFHMRKQVLKPH